MDDLFKGMRIMIAARTNLLLDVCHHCGATLYHAKVTEIDKEGIERKYCCIHCKNAKGDEHQH